VDNGDYGACPSMAVSSICTSSQRKRSGGVPTRRNIVKRDALEERRAKVMRPVKRSGGFRRRNIMKRDALERRVCLLFILST
jgi:hypothetical protein